MKQYPFLRITLSAIAASVLVLSLASCTSPDETTPLSSSKDNVVETSESPVATPAQSGSLDCNWAEARLIVSDYNLPSDQQGDLSETLVGEWQNTHYDLGLGDGWESWEDGFDKRYVFADSSELVHCVIFQTGDRPSESGATYSVTGDQILLDNGNGWTAVAWTNDVLLISNHYDDSLELYHRR